MADLRSMEEEEYNDKVMGLSRSRKRLRKSKSLEFVGWGSRNLIEFLESVGADTTNRISEHKVSQIIRNYIRETIPETQKNKNKKTKKTKTVACDETLRLLFQTKRINITKLPEFVAKHYVENQEDSYDDFICSPEDDKQRRLAPPSDKIDKEMTTEVVRKPKGKFAAIVSDNIKLLYLRKILFQELAKTPESFESKVMGTFVRIKNPCQIAQVTGVKEGNPIDGYLLQVTNYSYYLKDVFSSSLLDDDFSQEECEELHQRIKNGFAQRFTVVDMEEKARSLHEDVTKHWIARELVLLQRRINQANEKGWRRELSQYLERRELLQNPEEQSRLLREIPEVTAEELEPEPEPECVDDDGKLERTFMEPDPEASIEAHQSDKEQSDSPVSGVHKTLENSKLRDEEGQPSQIASADLHEDAKEQLANDITQQFEHEPDRVDYDVKRENDFMESEPEACIDAHQNEEEQQLSDSPVSSVQKTLENPKLREEEVQPTQTASVVEKDLHENVEEQLANDITQRKDSFTEGEMDTKVKQEQLSIPVIDLDNEPQARSSNPTEIIILSDDDDDEEDIQAYHKYDPKKVMWCYEFPKGKRNGPFSLTDLKRWSDEEYFVGIPDFKVWMTGNSIKSGVLLTKILPHIKA